jgi:hypothetical protein
MKLNGSSAPETVELNARKKATLASAIEEYSRMKVNGRLFWAKLRGHAEKKCINPFLLPCGFIEEETEVETEPYNGKIYEMQVDGKKLYSKPETELSKPSCTIFFISLFNRRKKPGITHVHYEKLGRNIDMCVVAGPGETYKEALFKDGRFKNVEYFLLEREIKGGKVVVPINDLPYEHGKPVVLHVTVKATAQSTNAKPNSMTPNKISCPTTSTTSDGATAMKQQQAVSETPTKPQKADYKKLGETLWRKNIVFDFREDVGELTSEEMQSEMGKCLKARAWHILFGPNERAAKTFEKPLEKLAKIEFANHHIIPRPVSFTKKLCEFFDSVGFIECGDIHATCFLASTDYNSMTGFISMIATNWHVVDMIEKARKSSTHVDYSKVFVHFDYEESRSGKQLSNGRKLLPFDFPMNVKSHELDYAFLFLEAEGEEFLNVKPLGEYVTCEVPHQGNVCIVAHPFGNVKQHELCPILTTHADSRSKELERRIRESKQRYRNSPSASTLYMYCPDIRKLGSDTAALAYDVGHMFEGSSGAPVFDMKCNIVALHTLGFRLGSTSIIETGVTFKAIIDHLEASGYSDFVRQHFPYCCDEDMEIEDRDF